MTIDKAIKTDRSRKGDVSDGKRLITLSGRRQSTILLDLRQRFLPDNLICFSMLTKELAIAERVQPRFIEPMYADAVRELPDAGAAARTVGRRAGRSPVSSALLTSVRRQTGGQRKS